MTIFDQTKSTMKFRIKIDRLKVFAYIGVFYAEKTMGNHFEVSVSIGIDIPDEMADKDEIENTLNYSRIVESIKNEMKESCDLIETVALKIARKLMDYASDAESRYKIENVEVTVNKLNPPIPYSEMAGASVTVSLP